MEDDYFENAPQSISFKNRDIFANFGGDQENASSATENYGTKPAQSDDLNTTHQSLVSAKDDRRGANNRINPDALQNGSSSNIKSV